ncbi:hypothetical protein DENSPDRAFT_877987 [Dentipellis sp. KUC8613]|nr:hypothetical protein DENSPDRAFT_877987 [Dentipellis sp. KUC8613]
MPFHAVCTTSRHAARAVSPRARSIHAVTGPPSHPLARRGAPSPRSGALWHFTRPPGDPLVLHNIASLRLCATPRRLDPCHAAYRPLATSRAPLRHVAPCGAPVSHSCATPHPLDPRTPCQHSRAVPLCRVP